MTGRIWRSRVHAKDEVMLSHFDSISTGNARRYVHPPADAGIIIEFTDRARNRAWRAPQILEALDAFAERAGRRR